MLWQDERNAQKWKKEEEKKEGVQRSRGCQGDGARTDRRAPPLAHGPRSEERKIREAQTESEQAAARGVR